MKKLLKVFLVFGFLVVFLFVVLLAAPFLIDFNKFKPQIQKVVAENVNAQLDFESARLTILDGLGVKLTNVSLVATSPEFKGEKVFQVETVRFFAEVMPLIREQRLVGHVEIAEPDIRFLQKGDKNVFATFAKPSDKKESKEDQPAKKANDSAPPSKDQVNDITKRVVVQDLEVRDARFVMLNYVGKAYVEKTRVDGLNLIVQNIGANREIRTTLSTNVTVNEAGARVSGPVVFDLKSQIDLDGSEFKMVKFLGKFSLDKLDINYQNAFVKRAGIPLHLAFRGAASAKSLQMDEVSFRLHTLQTNTSLKVSNFDDLSTHLKVVVENRDLAKLGDLLPQHKKMLTKGSLKLDLELKGALKQPHTVKASLGLSTQLTGADLALAARLDQLEPPTAQVKIVSKNLDLDALLRPFIPAKEDTKAVASGETKKDISPAASSPVKTSEAPASSSKDIEAMIPPELRKQLRGANVTVSAQMGRIKFGVIDIRNLVLDLQQRDLKTVLKEFSLAIFGGTVQTAATVDITESLPRIGFDFAANFGDMDVVKIASEFGVDLRKKDSPPPAAGKPTAPVAPAGNDGAGAGTANPEQGSSAKDIALTADQKRLLARVQAKAQVAIRSMKYNDIVINNFDFRARVADLKALVENFSLNAFEGGLRFRGAVNLGTDPISFESDTQLKGIEISQLIAVVKPEHKELLKGKFSLEIPLRGRGTTVPTIEKSLTGKGGFLLQNGELNTTSITPLINEQINKTIGGLSILKVGDGIINKAEGLLNNPLAQKLAAGNNFDLAKMKADYNGFQNIKVPEGSNVDGTLKQAQGTLEIKDGRIAITSQNETGSGKFAFVGSVGLDLTLAGGGDFFIADGAKAKMVKQSRHADLLFDDKGDLVVPVTLGGTVTSPKVGVNLKPLTQRFTANATKRLDEEVLGRIRGIVAGERDKYKQMLNQKAAEAKAKLEAAKAEAKAKLDAERKKVEARVAAEKAKAKAKADEEAKKALESKKVQDAKKKAGDKVKGLFGK